MSSFQELEAIAAKRAAGTQAKLMVERAERLRHEKEQKAKADQEARLRAQRERDAIVARDQRKRKEAECKLEEERKRKERAERIAKQQEADARGKPSASSPMFVQARKFADAKKKAIVKAGSSSKAASRRGDEYGVDWRENEIKVSRGSTLTREEKRLKQQAMMLGMGDSSPRSNKRKRPKPVSTIYVPPMQDLIPVGLVKRDHRSIDEIERDLHLAKAGKGSVATISDAKTVSRPATKVSTAPKLASVAKNVNHLGLSPADYLPGAPLRVGAKLPPSRKKELVAPPAASRKAKKPVAEPTLAPAKRETARDRFLREEEERRRQKAKLAGASKRFEEDSDMSGDDDDEGSSGLYDDEEDDEQEHDGHAANYRDEIWKLFGRDRKEYVNRAVDSDDDMEADLESVAREEARSARLARLEDEREERDLRMKAAEKAAKKAAAAKARR